MDSIPRLLPPEAVLLVPQVLCACLLLLSWLWRHWRVQPAVHRRRSTPPADPPTSVPAHPRAKPEWVRKQVLYLASHLHSCREVANVFNRWHGPSAQVGKTWVWEVMRGHAQEIEALRRERKRRKPAFISVSHEWALDLTFIRSPQGVMFTILGILDAGSRRLLCLKVLPGKCVHLLLAQLHLAFAKYGLPHAIRTDNEGMFTGRLWQATLKVLAIAHHRGPPRQAWRNGRIERLFGTLKALLGQLRLESAAALQAALEEFTEFYNIVRPHQGLAGLTPEEAWRGRTMADVQKAHAHAEGQWVEALNGLLVGYHLRCQATTLGGLHNLAV